MVEGMSVVDNVMLSNECDEPALCSLSVRTVVKLCTLDVLALGMSLVAWKKRHSLHAVGLLQTSAQIVSTQFLPTEMGARFRFWASRPSLHAAWLALLLTKAGDVESIPGLTTPTNKHTSVI